MEKKTFKIGIFASNSTMVEHIKNHAATDEEIEPHISNHGLDLALPVARKMVRDGIEIILSRRGTAHLLRENLQIPVLTFPQSDLDLILRLKEASKMGNKILLPIFRSRLEHLDELFQAMNINVVQQIYTDKASLEQIISQASQQGIEVIVGGGHSVSIAKGYGFKTAEISSSKGTIVSTIEDAKSVIMSNRQEHEISHKYQTVINATSEGIIAVDRKGSISAINTKAQSLLGTDEKETLGKKISSLIKSPQILRSINERRTISDNIEKINNKSFVFNHIPIILENQVVGGVSTFTDVGNLMKTENKVRKKLSKGLIASHTLDNYLHSSQEMKELIARVKRFAKTNSTILITGETGTGKEIIAQSVHNLSHRKDKPFVSINCAAIPEHLLESELFGYEEGAFTGSRKGGKPGMFELAHAGSIFLDEISAAPLSVQTRLLRVLQEREVMRIGSDRMIPIDVRIIAAANRDLAVASREGNFRSDLYFRINVLQIKLPPLRKRTEDIPLLMESFLRTSAKEHNITAIKIPANYMKLLYCYPWPGNVRQLKNFAERMALLCKVKFDGDVFDELYEELQEYYTGDGQEVTDSEPEDVHKQLTKTRNSSEADSILLALKETRFNKNKAAKMLGMSRVTLWRRMKNLGLDNP